MLYTYKDRIAGYSICISDYEKEENAILLEEKQE
jgi:hypothetical protein